MSQLVHAVGMRDTNKSVFKMNHLENRYMIVAWTAGIALQALVTEIPYFVELFGTSRLSLSEWGILGALSCVPLVIHELLVLSEALLKKAGVEESENPGKGQNHEDKSRKPGEAAGAL